MIVYKKAPAGAGGHGCTQIGGETWFEVYRTADAALPGFLLRDNPDIVVETEDGSRYRVTRI